MQSDNEKMLQEIVQKNKQETLEYRLAGQSGPDHGDGQEHAGRADEPDP